MKSTAINLSNLPAPDVIETKSFEEIFGELLADLQSRDTTYNALLESDPAYKQLEAYAYRELLLRQRINDAARAIMLAHAKKADLDNLAAFSKVERQVIIPADPDAVPPVPAVMESDESLLNRAVLAWEGITTAGSVGSYIFHSLSADSRVQDAAVNPDGAAGVVDVAVLALDSADNAAVVAAVAAALDADNVRPLTDNVNVTAAVENTYNVTAELTIKSGVSSDVVLAAANTALDAYAAQCARLGVTVARSGILAALHNDGVISVNLTAPAADLIPAWNTVYKLDVKTISQA